MYLATIEALFLKGFFRTVNYITHDLDDILGVVQDVTNLDMALINIVQLNNIIQEFVQQIFKSY